MYFPDRGFRCGRLGADWGAQAEEDAKEEEEAEVKVKQYLFRLDICQIN